LSWIDPGRIDFRPVTAQDYELLENWMQRPHWQEWWGEVDTELGHIREMVEGRDSTRPFLFLLDGEPAGYIQVWIIADHLAEPWLSKAPWLRDVPADSVGVDLSIGTESNLGKGLGTAVLKAFLERLAAEGRHSIIIDPDAANLRAIRAYEKAGFKSILVAPGPERKRPRRSLIMQLAVDGNQAQSSNQAGIQG
jgi:RimJ/RimL family protein N-acetyltransferase